MSHAFDTVGWMVGRASDVGKQHCYDDNGSGLTAVRVHVLGVLV